MVRNLLTNTYVKANQEYRVLVWDRQLLFFCYLPIEKCDQYMETEIGGEEVEIKRYEPIDAYVFKKGSTYPQCFASNSKDMALAWAIQNCVERRDLPYWWHQGSMELGWESAYYDTAFMRRPIKKKDNWSDKYYARQRWENSGELEYHI